MIDDNKSQTSKYGSVKSGAAKSAISSSKNASQSKKDETIEEKPKYELPKECQLEFHTNLMVEKMSKDYILAGHPYPQLEGEMVMF